jgi:hypothetical protein
MGEGKAIFVKALTRVTCRIIRKIVYPI